MSPRALRPCAQGQEPCVETRGPRASNPWNDAYLYRASTREEQPMANRNRQVLLKRRPTGVPTPADFDITDAPLPDPTEGEVLVRGDLFVARPYMRGRISGQRSYARPVEVGAVMEGRVLARLCARAIRASARATLFWAGMAGSSTAPSQATASSSSIRPRRRSPRHSACSACRG